MCDEINKISALIEFIFLTQTQMTRDGKEGKKERGVGKEAGGADPLLHSGQVNPACN
jgi:hypothetical protein